MDHLLQLDRVSGLGIEALIGVTELAQADLSPAAAMLGQRIVAAVAFRRGGDLADGRDGPPRRHEVEERIREQRPWSEVALDLAPDRLRERGGEPGGPPGGE